MEIVMDRADIKVGKGNDGTKVIIAEDKMSGIRLVIPLDENGARIVATALIGGLHIVDKMPTAQ